MFWLILPAGYAAGRLAKAAIDAPENTKVEAIGKEVGSLTVDAAKVAAYATKVAVGLGVEACKAISKPSQPRPFTPPSNNRGYGGDDDRSSSMAENWVETSGFGEGGFNR